jgi:hypothetical protein
MTVLGHSDVRTAMRYMHPETELIREIINHKNGSVGTTRFAELTWHIHDPVI